MSNNPNDCPWTVAQIELLKQLWLAGHSSKEIGLHIGVSRSSVLGKLNRMGMLRNDSRLKLPQMQRLPRTAHLSRGEQATEQGKPKRREPTHSLPFPPPPPPAAPPPPEPAIGSYGLLDLKPGQCRWPSDNTTLPYTFCGARQAPDSSYCSEHHRRSLSASALRPVNPGYFKLGQP